MHTIIKYIISGGIAAIVDLVILNFLDSLHFHTLISVNIAFLIAFIVSFSFQKYWTFQDSQSDKVHRQLTYYFIISTINMLINSLIVSLILHLNIIPNDFYLRIVVWAQIIASAIIAIESFIISRYFIFKKDKSKINMSQKINILIITQKLDMNDSYFGFFHDWVKLFAKNSSKVTVISLETYKYDLEDNVKVLSLGKEKNNSKIKYLYLLWKYVISERKNYDIAFCHMSPLYVICAFLPLKFFNKKIALWYVHRSVDLKLKIATILSDIIFTATAESFGIKSKKVNYMGQAVHIKKFERPIEIVNNNDTLKIITVGRITSIKRLEILIRSAHILKAENTPFQIDIIGAPVTASDFDYEKELKKEIKEKNLENEVKFIGPIANKDIPRLYWNSDIFVNLAPTGGLDKAVLEAMAASLPVIVTNKAFEKHLGIYAKDLLCMDNSIKGLVNDLSQKIMYLYKDDNSKLIAQALYKEVKDKSSLDILILSIVKNLNGII